MNTVALVLAIILFLTGVAGIILPALPGIPLIWVGMLLYGLMTGFQTLSAKFLIIQGLLAVASLVLDYVTAALGSRYFGGSKASTWGAAIGLLAGFSFFPLGLFLGPFLGAFIAELIYTQEPVQSLRSGAGALLGFWGGLPLKLILAAAMIIWFFIVIF